MTLVARPGRYVGGEWNAVVKPEARARIALVFPDVYEIGMSHLGLRLLYEIVNREPRWAAERAFAPWPDQAAALRASGSLLATLESKSPLKNFPLVGVSLTYELAYPDLIELLALGGIPARAADRGAGDPIILAGGPCALHAAPVWPFLDALFLGEADAAILEMMAAIAAGATRAERLAALGRVAGVKLVGDDSPATRRVFFGFGGSPGLRRPVTPLIDTVHDRVTVEIARGCAHGCRFCQAGTISRPERHRPVEAIVEEASAAIRSSGQDELSLLALSACDHPGIREIAARLAESFRGEAVSLSIPSTRVDALDLEIHRALAGGRRTGITLAPETATERMDRVVNKGASRAALRARLEEAFAAGWKSVKLYFMIGLPFETLADAVAIGDLLREFAPLARRSGAKIRAAVSILRPKPWTPFQWIGMERPASLNEKIAALRNDVPRGVTLDLDRPEECLVEAALARGDGRLAEAVQTAWRSGLTLQAWGERFDLEGWRRAFAAVGLDLEEEACRSYPLEAPLPWEDIEIGIDRGWLEREWRLAERAAAGEATSERRDCSLGVCTACGLPCAGTMPVVAVEAIPRSGFPPGGSCFSQRDSDFAAAPARAPLLHSNPEGNNPPSFHRVAFIFARHASAAMISHLELMKQFERAFRRAGIKPVLTAGFNPRPRLRFALSLPLGVEADAEYAEVDLVAPAPPDFAARLNAALPPGIRVARTAPPAAAGLPTVTSVLYRIISAKVAALETRLRAMLTEELSFTRKGKVRKALVADFIEEPAIVAGEIHLRLRLPPGPGLPISEILNPLREIDPGLRVVRTSFDFSAR